MDKNSKDWKEYYRKMAKEYYHTHPERKDMAKESYHKRMKQLRQEPRKLAEYKMGKSINASLYYSNRLWRDLYNANKDADWEELYVIVKVKSMRLMTDYHTVRNHMECVLSGLHRVPKEICRTVATVMREAIREYESRKK